MDQNTEQKKCFVITPIGPVGSPIRRKVDGLIDEVIQPVMKELGYKVQVSHRINDNGTMTPTIIKNVYNCDLAIANLTGNNPNVMYEVALRHASAKPIIHITENVSDLPFDINDQRTIEYSDDMSGALELKEKLKRMVESIDFSLPVSNPVTDALEKKDIVNIPQETTVDFTEILSDIQSEIKYIKRELNSPGYSTIRSFGTGQTNGFGLSGCSGVGSKAYGLSNWKEKMSAIDEETLIDIP